MKQLTCEMCGSTNLMKQDGVFVCQDCGTKYSVEEAKKMMVEGTVSVVGTVSIDNSGSYDRILELARDAFADKRFESAYDYYCQAVDIRQNEVENVLRQGLSILAKDGIQSSVPSSCTNRVIRAIDLIKAMPEGEEKQKAIKAAIEDIEAASEHAKTYLDEEIRGLNDQKMKTRSAGDILADLGRPAFVASQNQAEDKKIERHNKAIDEKISAVSSRKSKITAFCKEYSEKVMECADDNVKFGYFFEHNIDKAVELFPKITLSAEEQKSLVAKSPRKLHDAAAVKNVKLVKMLLEMGADANAPGGWLSETPLFAVCAYTCEESKREAALEILDLLLAHGAKINSDEEHAKRTLLNTQTDEEIKKRIIEKDPSAQNKITTAPQPKTGCCYVATAVYGSYDCPQVWTLRRYRDETLAKTWYGRAFVHTYYAISPFFVRNFGDTQWFKKMWRGTLDKMVQNLQNHGYESTPYEDQEW